MNRSSKVNLSEHFNRVVLLQSRKLLTYVYLLWHITEKSKISRQSTLKADNIKKLTALSRDGPSNKLLSDVISG